MNPRAIIAQSWAITKGNKDLRRWGFVSSLFETLRTIEIFLYQSYFLYWYFNGKVVGWLSVEILFFDMMPIWLFVIVTIVLILILLLEIFIPTIATGALIGLAAKAYRKEETKGGLVLALYNFLPILETHGLFLISNIIAVVTVWSLILRYGGDDAGLKVSVMSLLAFIWIFGMTFRFLASFSEEGIVIRKYGVFKAIGRSFKLIISYLSHVVFLLLMLIMITLRILINAIMIFLVPGAAIGLGLLLAFFLPKALSYTIAFIVGLILVVLLSYFLAYLHVFKQTVWTITYLKLSEKKDLDVILPVEELKEENMQSNAKPSQPLDSEQTST
jgi:hypothetical protein